MAIAKLLLKNATWSMLSHLLCRGSLMAASIFLARSFSPSDFSAYGYFQLTTALVGAYLGLGLSTTAARFFAQSKASEEIKESPPLGALFAISIVAAMIGSILIYFLPNSILLGGFNIPKLLFLACVAALVLRVVPEGAVLGLERYQSAAFVSFGYAVIILSSAYVAVDTDSPSAAMMGIFLATLFQACGEFFIALRDIGVERIRKGFTLGRENIEHVTHVAGPLFLVTLMMASGPWILGRIILSVSDGEKLFALFVIGLQWYSLALVVPGMVSRVVLPRLIHSVHADLSGAKEIVRKGVKLAVVVALLITVSAVTFAPLLSAAYGESYDIDRLFVGVFMVAALIISPQTTLGNALHAVDGQLYLLRNAVIWFLVLLVTGYTIIPSDSPGWDGAIVLGGAGLVHVGLAFLTCRKKELI